MSISVVDVGISSSNAAVSLICVVRVREPAQELAKSQICCSQPLYLPLTGTQQRRGQFVLWQRSTNRPDYKAEG
jgi:hypothetical protein